MADGSHNRSQPERITVEEYRLARGRRARHARPGRKTARLVNANAAPGAAFSTPPVKVTLPFLPPSINKLFCTVRDDHTGVTKRVLTKTARRVRRLIGMLVHGRLAPDELYELNVEIHLNAYTKKGSVRRVDLTNRIKFLEDCVCSALGIDDRQIFRVIMNKHHSDVQRTVITLDLLRV